MSPQQNQYQANRDKKDMPEVQASSRTPNQNQQNSDRKHASPRPRDDEDDMRNSKLSQKDRDEDDKGWKSPSR